MTELPQSKKTIILVEDEADIRLLYAEVLTDAGFNVIAISDGELALDKAKEITWDLMLLDIILPSADGMKVLKQITSTPELNKGKIVLLTNLSNEGMIKEAFENGVAGYLIKSEVTPGDVVAEAQRFLSLE